jgi:FkbM family methyltransferase
MQQILKSFFHLLHLFFSERNFLIFLTHVKLFFASFIHHRFKKIKSDKEKHIRIMGYKIFFFSYPTLINQFEEIFIYKSYRFESNTQNPLIFDCGSNIGISILYFKIFHPDSRIVAFEPDPENFRLLKKNIECNKLENVALHNYALGKEDGLCKLFNSPSGKGSLNTSIYANEPKEIFINVRMKRLSSFIKEEIDFMKIDVEGAEGEIINDLSEAGKLNSIKEMVIEYHPKRNLSADKLILPLKNAELPLICENQLWGKEKNFRFKRT